MIMNPPAVSQATARPAAFIAALGDYVLRRQTTNATPAAITTDGAAPTAANQIRLASNSAYAGRLLVTAKAVGLSEAAVWVADIGAIRAVAANTTTMFVGGSASMAPTGAYGLGSAWRLTIAADGTNGGISVSGTGEAGKIINWVARSLTSQAGD